MFGKIKEAIKKLREPKKLVLPEGFEIVTDGKVFRWRYGSYLAMDDYRTKEEVIKKVWSLYNYCEKERKGKEGRKRNWEKVEL